MHGNVLECIHGDNAIKIGRVFVISTFDAKLNVLLGLIFLKETYFDEVNVKEIGIQQSHIQSSGKVDNQCL